MNNMPILYRVVIRYMPTYAGSLDTLEQRHGSWGLSIGKATEIATNCRMHCALAGSGPFDVWVVPC